MLNELYRIYHQYTTWSAKKSGKLYYVILGLGHKQTACLD